MQYAKTVKDEHNDTARVQAYDEDGNVDFWTRQSLGDLGVYLSFTPSQARALAKALKRAANVAEGKPAKAKREVVDNDGDTWRRRSDGLYECLRGDGDVRDYMTPRTVEQIRNDYGIQAAGE